MKKIYKIVFFIFGFLFLTSCTTSNKNGKLNIVTSLNPNMNLIKYIAQDKINLYNLSFNSSSHNFEAKPEDIKKIDEADVVFYNGLGIDDNVLDFHKDKNKFVRTTNGTTLIELRDSNGNITYDPHVWLSLKEYKIMGKNVLDKLVIMDSKNKDFYIKNYNDFVDRIDSIYNLYRKDFENLINKKFISNHGSYGYLSRDFDLLNKSLYDVNNHGEANPKDIENIIEIIKSENIRLIIGDEFESNRELETILNETGINYKLVNTLESRGDYFTEYEKLLSSIYDGLK